MQKKDYEQLDSYKFYYKDILGQGQFGKVYKGMDTKNNVPVAIKVIDKQLLSDDYVSSALIEEIEIIKQLKSPNIVQQLEIKENPQYCFIIQEYCDGGDLRNMLNQAKFFKEEQVIQILIDILNGFLELLKMNIIHRDLKPENILINQGIIKIADFGLATNHQNYAQSLAKQKIGTPLYMSPQIKMNQEYTFKCDIWSLGVIIYELLYGIPPQEAISQIVNLNYKNYIIFPSTQQQVSENLKDFIRKCLQQKEEDRISWIEVYNHPILQNYFIEKFKIEKMENKAQFVIDIIKEQTKIQNISYQDLFLKQQPLQDFILDFQKFQKFISSIDIELSQEEIKYIFNKFDKKRQNQIDSLDFQNVLENNQIQDNQNNNNNQQQNIIYQSLNNQPVFQNSKQINQNDNKNQQFKSIGGQQQNDDLHKQFQNKKYFQYQNQKPIEQYQQIQQYQYQHQQKPQNIGYYQNYNYYPAHQQQIYRQNQQQQYFGDHNLETYQQIYQNKYNDNNNNNKYKKN